MIAKCEVKFHKKQYCAILALENNSNSCIANDLVFVAYYAVACLLIDFRFF